MDPLYKLDNPAWHSLNEEHRAFAVGNEALKFYPSNISPFGGINSPDVRVLFQLDTLFKRGDSFYLFDELPELPPNYTILSELLCVQMVCENTIPLEVTEKIIYLNDAFAEPLGNLVNLVQPGYFRPNTRLMGDYFGIFQQNQLVAVTGERMRMHDFTEISAVVTHPDFVGRGYAKQLVAYTVNKNLAEGKIAYLHVAGSNTLAITLYEKLGFQWRRDIMVRKIQRE